MIGVDQAIADPERRSVTAGREPLKLASFPPPIPQNPYQRLLYDALGREGVALATGNRFDLGWLGANRGRVDVLHFHWPEAYYRHRNADTTLTILLSWLRVGLFGVRLRAARFLGYRIVWTVHQARPHESSSPMLDRVGTWLLAAHAHLLVANDKATAEEAARSLRPRRKLHVVGHGSYVDVYPPGRMRTAVRAELGIDTDVLVFLSFGHLRRYKGLTLLLEAFAATRRSLPTAVLLVAGLPLAAEESRLLQDAAARDPRVRPLLGFVPDEGVTELFAASDVAVLARPDGGTSGSLILALSQGKPVIAASLPAYTELLEYGLAGWLFDPSRPESLTWALAAAAGEEPSRRAARAATAAARAGSLSWEASAHSFAQLIDGLGIRR